MQEFFFEKLREVSAPELETYLRCQGYSSIAGTDEVGRGCLAGPVVAAAVILPHPLATQGIKDSKQLSAAQREKLYDQISSEALAWGLGIVEAPEIDEINIFQASLKAMRLAVAALSIQPEILLLDGKHKIPSFLPQHPVVKGDQYCLSIGAASILAKVTRDRLMRELEGDYPDFQFSLHKGYPTEQHRNEIRRHGPTKIHRQSFRLLKED